MSRRLHFPWQEANQIMKSRSFLMRFAVLLTLVLTIALGLTRGISASTPTPDHGTHHAGTPVTGSACGTSATPGGVQKDVMSGTSGHGMMMNMEFDLAFIDMMKPHHEGAVAMAKVALERAEHEEVRTLAQEIIDAQDAEIAKLKAWRAEWYPDAPPVTMPDMMQMQNMGQMMPGMSDLMASMGSMHMDPSMDAASLCSVTDSFDLTFIDMMIPHHQSAIMMAQAALANAKHQELKDLAHEIIDAQQREIDQMTGWRAAWYGEAAPGTPAVQSDAIVVNVTLDEFAVTASPAEFHTGQTYRFVVTNTGSLPHEFMVLPDMPGIGQKDMEALHHVALGVIPVDDLAPGATREIDVTFAQAGDYQLVCALTGHYDAGMTLTVTAG
jgi:uncharacterized protein (DUF305 family)/uncharacterized cupredoxin-like copper-binding protein